MHMGTNRDVLMKGIRYMTGALPLFFLGPVVIYNSFMNKNSPLYIPVLIFGILLCLFGMWLMFFGLRTIMKSMFDK
jgi:Na+/H+ antiporter NhaB